MTTTHDHAHLRQLSTDPTNTTGIRKRFLKGVAKRFRALRGDIRQEIGYENDRLNLSQGSRLADAEDIERFPTDQGKIRKFMEWLRDRLRSQVLEPLPESDVKDGQHWTATFIRSAYARGWANAEQRLQNAGVSVPDDSRPVFDLGVPTRQLKQMYTRTYKNLESITQAAAPQVRDILTQGLAEGWNPRKMADMMTATIDTVQSNRAEVLARTEVINSYADATLDRYDQTGSTVSGVTVSGEFATADDDRVCPLCESIEGTEYTTQEMRTATFDYTPDADELDSLEGTYPVKPPVHPQCRCAILPVVS